MRFHCYRDPQLLYRVCTALDEALSPGIGWTHVADPAMYGVPGDWLVCAEEADFHVLPLAILVSGVDDWIASGAVTAKQARQRIKELDRGVAQALEALPFFAKAPERHVFFQLNDLVETFPSLSASYVFKHSARLATRDLAVSYCAAPALPRLLKPIRDCRHDVSFRGCAEYMEVRKRLPAAITKLEKAGFQCRFENVKPPYGQAQKDSYFELLADSRFVLCPRGIGLNSIRFFEALAYGRIPVLLSDEAKLPLDWVIPYPDFSLRVPEAEVERLPGYLEDFRARHDLEEASRLAMEIHRRYLSVGNIPGLIAQSLAHAGERSSGARA